MRIESGVGPDGKTRLIAYFKGQDTADGRGFDSSLGLAAGIVCVSERTTRRIDDPRARPRDGGKAEVMLVGRSRGGMDAQNIAASGRLRRRE